MSREAADRLAAQNLVPMGVGLAVLFLLFSVANYWLLDPPARTPMCILALASSVAMWGAVLAVRRHSPKGYAHAIATYGVLIGIINSAARLWLTGDPTYSATFGLVTLAVGLFYLDLRWGVSVIMLAVGTWGFAASPLVGAGAYAFTVIGAAMLAIVFMVMRVRIYGRLERMRVETEAQSIALTETEDRYQLALTGSNDGLYEWHVATNKITFTEQLSDLLGPELAPGSWSLMAVSALVHEDDFDRVRVRLKTHVESTETTFEDEFRIEQPGGEHAWVMVRGASRRDDTGAVVRMAGSVTDMSRRGVFDPLTGLPNRRLFLDRMGRVLARRGQEVEDDVVVVLFVDLDGFKLINDTHGHQAGDQLLRRVSARLSSCVRASDTVARLGGDEFVVLLDGVDMPVGLDAALKRIVKRCSKPYVLGGREVRVMPSIGVVVGTDQYSDPNALLRDADLAMYRAKESDDMVVMFDSEMKSEVAKRMRLETELRDAVAQRQFVLHFQSIVSLADGRVQGYEALSRWQHPTRGLVSPAEFIPSMEETGLIVELGAWVLREGCRIMMDRFAGMREADIPYLSVNLSGKHLAGEDLVGAVEAALDETGFPASRLRLELTESAIIDNPRRAASQLGQLRFLGVRILMDDFGTGHSSLSYLQNLPIDTLKIDRSFIGRMTQDPDGAELVRTIIRMTDNLGLSVVAEGIETTEQVSMLQAMECTSGQGFYFERPAPMGQKERGDNDAKVVDEVASKVLASP